MKTILTPFLLLFALVGVACGGSDSDESGGVAESSTEASTVSEEPPADLPSDCVEAPFGIELTIDGLPEYSGAFTVRGADAVAIPIVPNGDGSLDDLDPGEFQQRGAVSDLVVYTQWIGDHDFGDVGSSLFSTPSTPAGSVTLGLSVVPVVSAGLEVGDVISSTDEFEFDAITTFSPAGVYFQPADGVDTYFFVDNLDETQGATVEILYLDAGWLCARWEAAGETSQPDGTYSLSGVVLTPFERGVTPFT